MKNAPRSPLALGWDGGTGWLEKWDSWARLDVD